MVVTSYEVNMPLLSKKYNYIIFLCGFFCGECSVFARLRVLTFRSDNSEHLNWKFKKL